MTASKVFDLCVSAVLALLGGQCLAGVAGAERQLAVSVIVDDDRSEVAVEGTLDADVVFEPAGDSAAVRHRVVAPSRTRIAVPEGIGVVRTMAPGYWSHPVAVTESATDAVVRLIATGELALRPRQVADSVAEGWPGVLKDARVELRPSPSDDANGRSTDPQKIEISCQWRSPELLCQVPRGLWDIKLIIAGRAPVYFWQVQARRRLDLGVADLVAGASISGWVSGDPAVIEDAELRLRRQTFGWLGDPRQRRRMEGLAMQAKPDARGFFQLRGLAEGTYDLKVHLPALGEMLLTETSVTAATEQLFDDLEIIAPTSIQVAIDPPVAPDGEPWKLEVLRDVPKTQVAEEVNTAYAGLDGFWPGTPLLPGTYLLRIVDGQGQAWSSREIQHGDTTSFLQVDLDLVRIQGTFTIGGEARRARLAFGGVYGSEKVEIESDDEGWFEGVLPRRGTWPVDVRSDTLYLLRAEPVTIDQSDREPVTVTIEVPETRIHGRVVRRGRGVETAFVDVRSAEARAERLALAVTDEEGRFEIFGVPEGQASIFARHERMTSPWREFALLEGRETPEMILAIDASRTVSGQITCAGSLAAGAFLTLHAGAGRAFVTQARADGMFEVEIPEDTLAVNALVSAPGCATLLARYALEAEKPLDLRLAVAGAALRLRRPEWIASDAHVLYRGAASFDLKSVISIFRRHGHLLTEVESMDWVLKGLEAGPYQVCGPDGCREASTEIGLDLVPLPWRRASGAADGLETDRVRPGEESD